jgi:hypothetical protein
MNYYKDWDLLIIGALKVVLQLMVCGIQWEIILDCHIQTQCEVQHNNLILNLEISIYFCGFIYSKFRKLYYDEGFYFNL